MEMQNYQIPVFNELEQNVLKGQIYTIQDILRLAVSLFNEYKLAFGHGTDNAYDEAVYLILHTLNLPLDELDPYLEAKLLHSEINKLLQMIEIRVLKRLPIPYIIKEANFLGYTFYVDERVIIPRSYIAEIILDDGLIPWIEHPELVHNVLDLCTGNGSLAIVAADYFYDSEVVASDISEKALEVAAINCANYQLESRITLIRSDLFTKLADKKFDVILTNPPYVDKLRMKLLPNEYLHEPSLSLDGGDDGLVFIDKIIHNALNHLTPNGILVLEMGDNCTQLEDKYFGLSFDWLDTKNGQGFIFVVTYEALKTYFNQNIEDSKELFV